MRLWRYLTLAVIFYSVFLISEIYAQVDLNSGFIIQGRSYGFSLETESHGTALGVFYSSRLGEKIQVFGQFKFLDITGPAELPVYDPYTGITYKASAVNLVLTPVFAGVKYHPFIGQIANNFSPFIMFTTGPIAIFNLPEDVSFLEQWKNVETTFSGGAFVGFGSDFMVRATQYITFVLGYDFLPMGEDVDGRTDYNGTVIKIMLGKRLR